MVSARLEYCLHIHNLGGGKINGLGKTPSVQVVNIGTKDSHLLNEIVALGDQYRRTLGFLPPAAFQQAASSHTLVAAIHDGRVVGYALYSLPRQVVRLSHLCVSENLRGHGLTRLLVDEISRLHADRLGIVLKCRKDYAANGLWPHLGFELQGEVPGRSKQRLPLCLWRRDHGHPHLFSAIESLGLLRVALDVNVFLDLELDREREGAIESQSLADDWLVDQIELVVTSELSREIARLSSEPERSRQLLAAQRYRSLPADRGAIEATAQRILNHVARTQNLDLSADPSDISDVLHVAEAFLAGVTVLATRDQRLLRWSAEAIETCGVRVMRPADVVLHVDELARAQAYRPIELQDTKYRLTPVRSGSEADLLAFLHENEGEKKSEYMARVRLLRAEGRRWNRVLLRSPKGDPIAFYVTGANDTELVVPIFRVKTPRLENTVARQLLSIIRDQARNDGYSIVRITDPILPRYTEIAVRDNGFIRHKGSLVGFVISACADSATVNALATQAADRVDLRMPTLRPHLSPVIAAELERTLWPAKITDSDLPNYLIPIRPTWSAELFGVPRILMPRQDRLGISREHVYYRSPRPRVEQAPARLVWYVTGSGTDGLAAIIGCSRLQEVVRDKPAALYQAYRHLGVWQLEQIDRASRGNQALALRFADTEIFHRQVSLRRLRHLADENCQRLSLRSPQKISAELFAAIYQEGSRDA